MKKTLLLVAAICLIAGTAEAQLRQFYLGPSLMLVKGGLDGGKVSDSTSTPMNLNFVSDFGFTFRWMFNKNSSMGLLLDAEYSTYGFRLAPSEGADDNNTFVYTPSYITISPGIYLSGLTLNAAFLLPTRTGVQNVSGSITNGLFTITSNDMTSPSIDLRVGAQINVLDSETGILNVVIRGGYMVTGLLKDEYFGPGKVFENSDFNPNIISFGVGANYLFDLEAL